MDIFSWDMSGAYEKSELLAICWGLCVSWTIIYPRIVPSLSSDPTVTRWDGLQANTFLSVELFSPEIYNPTWGALLV